MQTDTVAFIRLSRAPPQESPVKTLVGLQSWNAGTVELGNSSSDPGSELQHTQDIKAAGMTTFCGPCRALEFSC